MGRKLRVADIPKLKGMIIAMSKEYDLGFSQEQLDSMGLTEYEGYALVYSAVLKLEYRKWEPVQVERVIGIAFFGEFGEERVEKIVRLAFLSLQDSTIKKTFMNWHSLYKKMRNKL